MSKTEYYLNEDIKSSVGKPIAIYGFAGEKVTEISPRGHVIIVEGKSGRFPVLKNQLTIKK